MTQLTLSMCRVIDDLSALSRCNTLKTLVIHECHAFRDLSPLASLPNLCALHLLACTRVVDLSPLRHCKKLQTLVLKDNAYLGKLSLSGCNQLQVVCIERCPDVTDLSPLVNCKSLKSVHLGGAAGTLWQKPCTKALEKRQRMGYLKIIDKKPRTNASKKRKRGDDPFDVINLDSYVSTEPAWYALHNS